MDTDAVRKKRAEDIEMKRKRLEEMRKNRDKDREESTPVETIKVSEGVESLVQTLLSSKATYDPKEAPTLLPQSDKGIEAPSSSRGERLSRLSLCRVGGGLHVIPMERLSYEKSVQTEDLGDIAETVDSAELIPSPFSSPERSALRRAGTGLGGSSQISEAGPRNWKERDKTIPEEERLRLLASPALLSFLATSSLYIERALEQNETYDLMRDWTKGLQGEGGAGEGGGVAAVVGPPFLHDHVSAKGRGVTCIAHHAHLPLFLACYGAARVRAVDEGGGSVGVWSAALHSRPFLLLTHSSLVQTALFLAHPLPQSSASSSGNASNNSSGSHAWVVAGGCSNGQVVVWDPARKSASPLLRSSLTTGAHRGAVVALALAPSSSLSAAALPSPSASSALLSLSSEGVVCVWDVRSEGLAPVHVVNLLASLNKGPSPSPLDLVASPPALGLPSSTSSVSSSVLCASSLGVGVGDTGPFAVLGCGSGQLLVVPLPPRPPAAPTFLSAHLSYVSCVSMHPLPRHRGLVLTGGLDWSVQLHDLRRPSKPLLTLPSRLCDYIVDLQWSPVCPSVFACLTSGGSLAFWSLLHSTTEPRELLDLLSPATQPHAHITSGAPALGSAKSAATLLPGKGAAATGVGMGGGLHKTHTLATLPSAAPAAAAPTAPTAPLAFTRLSWLPGGEGVLVGDSEGAVRDVRVSGALATPPSPQDEVRLELLLIGAAQPQ